MREPDNSEDPQSTPPGAAEGREWVADEAIKALSMERELRPSESSEDLANRIFEENLPLAASAITHLARNSQSERVRLEASKYVVERRLGRITDPAKGDEADQIWDQFLSDVTRPVDALADETPVGPQSHGSGE